MMPIRGGETGRICHTPNGEGQPKFGVLTAALDGHSGYVQGDVAARSDRGLGRAGLTAPYASLREARVRFGQAREEAVTGAMLGLRAAMTWRITSELPHMPHAAFDEEAVDALEAWEGGRLCCYYRPEQELRAAVAYEFDDIPGASIVVHEFALAHQPGEIGFDLRTINAAVLLLDRLHALAVIRDLSDEIWAMPYPSGCSHRELLLLGFEQVGTRNGGPSYARTDPEDRSAHPGRGLELLRRWYRWRRSYT